MQVPETTPRELPVQGAHIARCFQLIDLGTQKTSYKGVEKEVHQIQIGWELPELPMKDGRPFGAFKTYTWFMSEKANLRKDLESWRGRKFTETDLRGKDRFNLKDILGATCILTIVHKDSQDGERTYANIVAISPMLKGKEVPAPVNKPVYLGLLPEYFDVRVFEEMPEWMQEKIKESPEYRQLAGGAPHKDLPRTIPRINSDFPGDHRPNPRIELDDDLPEMR